MEISQNIMINNTYIDKFNIQSILNDDELIKTIILLKYNMNSSTLIEIIAHIFDNKYINQNQLLLCISLLNSNKNDATNKLLFDIETDLPLLTNIILKTFNYDLFFKYYSDELINIIKSIENYEYYLKLMIHYCEKSLISTTELFKISDILYPDIINNHIERLCLMIDINKIKNVNCFIKDFDELDFNDKQTIMNNLNLIDGEFKDKIYEINNNKQYMTLEYILNR